MTDPQETVLALLCIASVVILLNHWFSPAAARTFILIATAAGIMTAVLSNE